MNLFRILASVALAFSLLAPVSANTITFEELGRFSGVVQIGVLRSVDFGVLGAFDAEQPDYAYLASSPTNAAYFAPRAEYEIKMADGNEFDFLGASFVRSHDEGDFFLLAGKNDGVTIYSRSLESVSILRNGTPRFFDFDWRGIDSLSISWTGGSASCCSTGYAVMDDFTYQPVRDVPEPKSMSLFMLGLAALVASIRGNRACR